MNKLDTHNDKVPFLPNKALRQVQEALDTNSKTVSIGKEQFTEVKIDQGINSLNVQAKMFNGPEAKETTRTTVERYFIAPSHDKQRKTHSIKYEQSQVNGTQFINHR